MVGNVTVCGWYVLGKTDRISDLELVNIRHRSPRCPKKYPTFKKPGILTSELGKTGLSKVNYPTNDLYPWSILT